MFTNYTRRLHIWETDYGRDAGWLVERHGKTIAVLTDPLWIDMFWFSYRLVPHRTSSFG